MSTALRPSLVLVAFAVAAAEERALASFSARYPVLFAAELDPSVLAAQPSDGIVIVVGSLAEPGDASRFLAALASDEPGRPTKTIVLCSGNPALFQPLVDHDALFYLSRGSVPHDQLVALVEAAVSDLAVGSPSTRSEVHAVDDLDRRVLWLAGNIALRSTPEETAALTRHAVQELLDDRADVRVFIHDVDAQTLAHTEAPEERHSVASGLTGFVARTNTSALLDDVSVDSRFDPGLDDPEATQRGGRYMAVPITCVAGHTSAVVVGHRPHTAVPFTAAELRRIAHLARLIAPSFAPTHAHGGRARRPLFRAEALAELERPSSPGDVLRVSTTVLTIAVRGLCLGFALLTVFLLFGRISEYATGPAIVRAANKSRVVAVSSGLIAEIHVVPGQRVEAGARLVSLTDADEARTLQRIEREFALLLVQRLQKPVEQATAARLTQLRAERELLITEIRAREVRAPHNGVVSDVRAVVGEHVEEGDFLAAITTDESSFYILGAVPGRYRPRLELGMSANLRLDGFQHRKLPLRVDALGDASIGEDEARRYFGPEVSDRLRLSEASVLVRSPATSSTFRSDEETYELHDGMWGTLRVEMRSEPIIVALIPALRRIWDHPAWDSSDDGQG